MLKNRNHHRGKCSCTFFFWRVMAGIAVILFIRYAFGQNFLFENFRFIKPKPLVQSTKTLDSRVQAAIEEQAKQQIQEGQAEATLAVNTSIDGSTQTNQGLATPLLEALQEALTSNPADRAKIRIKRIDRLAQELQNLLTTDKSDRAVSRSVKLIQEIGQETDELVSDKQVQTDREILALQIAQYNRLQLIIQRLEDTVPIGANLKLEDARQKYLVATATRAINAAPNLEAIHNIAVNEIKKQVDEDFAELKAIEIVSDFENDVAAAARVKIIGLEKELAQALEKRMLKLPRDVRNRKLQNYIQYSFGDPLVQIKSFNRIKDFISDREVVLGIDSLKELAMKKLTDRIFELDSQETLNQFVDRVIRNPEDIKVLGEMQLAVNAGRDETRKLKIAQMQKNVEAKITAFFNRASAADLESYFSPAAGSPTDLLDMLMISNLNAIINTSPVASEQVKQKFGDIKAKTHRRFIEEISSKNFITKSTLAYNPVSVNADVRILLSTPAAISLLQTIKNESSPADRARIDAAIRAQAAILQEHILFQVNDPQIFADYQQLITQNPQLLGQGFVTKLSQKSQVIQKQAKEEEQKFYEVVQQIVQAIFITDDKTGFERKLPSDIQQQIAKLKKTLPDKNIPKLTVPEGVNLPKVAKLSDSLEHAIIQAAKQRIKEKQKPEEVKLDLTIQAKDLGVGEPKVLPDNPLYPVKKLARILQLALTLDPLQRAQTLITQDNIKTLEAAKLLGKSSSRKTIDLALSTLAEVEKDFTKLKESSTKLDKLRAEGPQLRRRINSIVDQIIRNGLARQTVFSSIEDKVYGRDYVRVEKIRQSVLKNGIHALLQLSGGDVQNLVQKLEEAVNAGSGSKFKELKAIELLTEIKRFQPKRIDSILQASGIRLVKQFEAHLLTIEKKEREQDLLAYADSIPGNPVRQFEAYEELKDGFTNPQTLLLAEALKDKAVENLRDQVSEVIDGATLQEFVTEVVGNKPEDLKIITEIELRVETPDLVGEVTTPIEEKIEEIKAGVVENIIENIIEDPTSLTESELISDLNQGNTTITDVEVIHELEEILESTPEVAPEVIETVHELEEQIIEDFVEAVTENPAQALEPVPQVIATLVELKEEQPPAVDATIDLAIVNEVAIVQEYLETQVDSPETFETYLAQIQESPEVLQVVTSVGGQEFIQAIEQTSQELSTTAQSEQTLLETTVAQVQEEIFSPTSNSTIVETLAQSVQEEIQETTQEVPAEQIPQVAVEIAEEPQQQVPVQQEAAPAPAAPEVKPPEQTVPAPEAPAAPAL